MWEASRQQAKKAWNIYGNLDLLRPYFDVQPHEVRTRSAIHNRRFVVLLYTDYRLG